MLEWVAKYWLQVLFGLLVSGLSVWVKLLSTARKRERERHQAEHCGLLTLIRDHILEIHAKCMAHNYCPVYVLENLHSLYKEYKLLGGNGAIEDLVEKVEKLPNVAEESVWRRWYGE